MSIIEILLSIAPEFNDTPIDRLNSIINIATPLVNFGDDNTKNLAIAYLSAHMLTISLRGGSGISGPVTSETEGNLSRSYGYSNNSSLYSSTSYGIEFERLAKMFIFKPRTRQNNIYSVPFECGGSFGGYPLSLINNSEPTRLDQLSRMPSDD